MYLNEEKACKVFINWASTFCMLLIFSVPGGTPRYFVRDRGTRGKEG
jgi:hypothetical protein